MDDFFSHPKAPTIFFDEGPIVHVNPTSAVITGTFDTSTIDAFRQGVEITQQKHYDAGIVKIFAGEIGHFIRPLAFGENETFMNSNGFVDIDTFTDPSMLINTPHSSSVVTSVSQTDANQSAVVNGVMDVLPRKKILSKAPVYLLGSFGALMAGKEDGLRASSQALTVDYIEVTKHQPPFVDTLPVAVSITGSQRIDQSVRLPFDDTRYVRNVSAPTAETADMLAALSLMTGSTDNYVTFKQHAATSGWVYETPAGTDSLAFGGLIY